MGSCSRNTEHVDDELKNRWLLQCVNGDRPETEKQIDTKWCLKKGADVNTRNDEGQTPLHIAARRENAALVDLLLKNGADVNTIDNNGNTPLHAAAEYMDAASVENLLKFGADVNMKNTSGSTPLLLAVLTNKALIVNILLESGADVNIADIAGCPPLHYAVCCKKTLIVDALLKFGADANVVHKRGYTLLHSAIRSKDAFLVERLLKFGGDVNATFGEHGTLLHQAVDFDEIPIVDLLLNYGADVNTVNPLGDTPLHLAIDNGKKEPIIERLLKYGADVNAINNLALTPLHLAVLRNKAPVVDMLLTFGADVNMKHKNSGTPLHYAANNGDEHIVERLLNFGADVNMTDSYDMTPLHIAAYNKNPLIVEQLLKFGSEVNITDNYGYTPLHRAVVRGVVLTIDLLLNRGAKVNAKNKKGNTPLHLAVNKPHLVDLLLKFGADVNTLNNAGDTPLHRAARHAKVPTVDLLLQFGANVHCMSGFGNMPLHEAVIYGNIAVVDLLLKLNVELNTTNIISNQPLTSKMVIEEEPRVKLPLEGSNMNTMKNIGNTPLHLAAYYRKASILDLLLKSGADVNAKNGAGNTPLHLAARCKHTDIVDMLLHGGADVKLRNFDSDTPLTVARVFNYEGNDEIITLLETAERLAPSKDEPQDPCNIFQCNNEVAIPNNNMSVKAESELKYSKRAGTSGVCGQLYETKLLCLVLIRALNDEQMEHFLLGTSIRDIGDMDDVCMRYQLQGRKRPGMLFVHAKHKEKGSLTVEDVRSASGDFSLRKYFESYLAIKDQFRADNDDPMFEGDFANVDCNLVIYTPAKDCFTKKRTERQVSEKVNYLIKTGLNSDVFQYDHDEGDVDYLTEITIMERLKKFGIAFLELIMSEKLKSDIQLSDKAIARYHVVVGRKVLQQCKIQEANKEYRMWEFRPEFFESDSKYLLALKMTFVKELSAKLVDHSTITIEDVENIKLLLRNPCAFAISKLIGKLTTYNDRTKKLHLADVSAFEKIIKKDEFNTLLEELNKIVLDENVINEAVQIKLTALEIKLPLAFGNIDMMFRGSEANVQIRMKAVADKLIDLLEINKDTKIIDINDDIVGPGKSIEQGILDMNGGIGSAVGNLLVFDTNTKMFKFDLDNESSLPENAGMFLKELKDDRYKSVNEELSSYRIKINVDGFPQHSFNGDENDKKLARDFLSKLWFYTNQAKENKVELILKNHINTYYNSKEEANNFIFEMHSNAIFLKSHDEIQKWWMRKGETSYLTKATDLFERAKLACMNNVLLTVINYMNYLDISSIHFKFNQRIHQNYARIKIPELSNDIFGKIFDKFDTQGKSANISIEDRKEIVNIMQTVEKIANKMVSPKSDLTEAPYNIYQSNGPVATPHNYLQNNAQRKFEFLKRAGTSGICGQLYETKLLCLVLMRALNDEDIEHFLLGTNIRDIGDMDDVCLRYRVRGYEKPVLLFVQAKHREDLEKGKITVNDVRNVTGDFSLRKYFESYLTIKDRFRADNEDAIFEGDFGNVELNLVIYTPAKNCFTKKKTERQVSEKVNYLIKTGLNSDVFQYYHDEGDIDYLTEITVIERMKKFGIAFLDLIMSEKLKSDIILVDKLIARYHVIMALKVLQQCKIQKANKDYRMWEFRPEFFESDCKYLLALKMTFVKELSAKRVDRSKITIEDVKNVKLLLQNPCASTTSKLIGKLATYNDRTKKLHLADFSAFKKIIKKDEFNALLEEFNKIVFDSNIINEAVRIKLAALEIKLPLAFGNLDMMFRGSEAKVQKRMKAVADKLIHLFEINKDTKIIDINDDIVGPGKSIEQGIIDINGGIGSAVGNLLVLDTNTKMLKFDLDNESSMPKNSGLFLKQLKDDRYKSINEELSSYRIKINIDGFPQHSFNGDENDKKLARDFLSKIWFYTNQAKENEVEQILKDEIVKFYSDKIGQTRDILCRNISDSVFLISHDEIQKWWMQTDESPYLSRASELFERAERADIDNLFLTVVNYMYISKIYSIDINIRQFTTEYNKFVQMHQTFNKISGRIFCIFDLEFNKQIDIQLPDDLRKRHPDAFFTDLVFSLEIHPEMEWVALKISAKCGGYTEYILIAKAGPGRGCRHRPQNGFLLVQKFGSGD